MDIEKELLTASRSSSRILLSVLALALATSFYVINRSLATFAEPSIASMATTQATWKGLPFSYEFLTVVWPLVIGALSIAASRMLFCEFQTSQAIARKLDLQQVETVSLLNPYRIAPVAGLERIRPGVIAFGSIALLAVLFHALSVVNSFDWISIHAANKFSLKISLWSSFGAVLTGAIGFTAVVTSMSYSSGFDIAFPRLARRSLAFYVLICGIYGFTNSQTPSSENSQFDPLQPASDASAIHDEFKSEELNNFNSGSRISVGTIGQFGHGKSDLVASIISSLPERVLIQNKGTLESCEVEVIARHGVPARVKKYVYDSGTFKYTHFDCVGHADHIKALISGAIDLDIAILVFDSQSEEYAQAIDQLATAQLCGVAEVVVFLNNTDLVTSEALLRTEQDLLDLVERYYPNRDFDFIHGTTTPTHESVIETNEEINSTDLLHPPIQKLLTALDRASQRVIGDQPSAVKPERMSTITALVYALEGKEGGAFVPFFAGKNFTLAFPDSLVRADLLSLPDNVAMVMPGDSVEVQLGLATPMPLANGTRFEIREGGQTRCVGIVTGTEK